MNFPLWDCLSFESKQMLCTIQFNRYQVLPDVQPVVEKRAQPVEEVNVEIVKEMVRVPEYVKEATA